MVALLALALYAGLQVSGGLVRVEFQASVGIRAGLHLNFLGTVVGVM